MECGGSDGNSGVTANPAPRRRGRPGRRPGGIAVLGETTEIYGAEHLLTRRAVTPRGRREADRADQVVGVVRRRLRRRDQQQPVAGEQERRPDDDLREVARGAGQGGLDRRWSTSSATPSGSIRRAWSSWTRPAYDPPCTTGLVAGGANVLVFTTGRGSVLGLKPTPCIKVATNTPMFERMSDDMDLNAGTILEGEPVEAAGRRIFELILDVAGGQPHQERAQRRRRGGVRPLADRADALSRPDPGADASADGGHGGTPCCHSLALARAGLVRLVPDRAAAQRQERRGDPPPLDAPGRRLPAGRAGRDGSSSRTSARRCWS